jgi:EAL domain-containing protein (putative c-di-GMP-specific phosphodiesterase class I)
VIAAAMQDRQAQAVLLAIVAYASRAEAFVIAEGIETEQTLQFVRNAGEIELVRDLPIRGGQGYLLGRPSSELPRVATSRAG